MALEVSRRLQGLREYVDNKDAYLRFNIASLHKHIAIVREELEETRDEVEILKSSKKGKLRESDVQVLKLKRLYLELEGQKREDSLQRLFSRWECDPFPTMKQVIIPAALGHGGTALIESAKFFLEPPKETLATRIRKSFCSNIPKLLFFIAILSVLSKSKDPGTLLPLIFVICFAAYPIIIKLNPKR